MRPVEYVRAEDLAAAVALVSADPEAEYLAGGTTEVDLVLKDGVLDPGRLVDITRLPLGGITLAEDTLRVGALTTMEELAADPTVSERVPLVREALLAGASPQLRNMATIGGNLLQRTRCRYFRDSTVTACNKRFPGSGCAALLGPARMHAILGASEHCIALHPSDLCVPLVALDTVVDIQGVGGSRHVPLTRFYVLPGDRPDIENVLEHGELITRIRIPLPPVGTRSGYLKVRDRASFEFALTSAAAALRIEDGTIVRARLAVGGVGTMPWRALEAEEILNGAPATGRTFRAAARAALGDPFTVGLIGHHLPRREPGRPELAAPYLVSRNAGIAVSPSAQTASRTDTFRRRALSPPAGGWGKSHTIAVGAHSGAVGASPVSAS